jgi:hypothetical protein
MQFRTGWEEVLVIITAGEVVLHFLQILIAYQKLHSGHKINIKGDNGPLEIDKPDGTIYKVPVDVLSDAEQTNNLKDLLDRPKLENRDPKKKDKRKKRTGKRKS